jgi:anthranilate phosphoribosyltransferase
VRGEERDGRDQVIRSAIRKTVERVDLSRDEVRMAFGEMTAGEATDAQIGALLSSLRMKGETVEELIGAAEVLRENAVRIPVSPALRGDLLDTCGTGGDRRGTFNVSTVSAFVAAGAGAVVAKHGNRSVSSRCGSADLVEALGIPLDLEPEEVGRSIEENGIGFLYAPALHGSMRHVAGPRRELGMRTVFNVLGPLANPAGASRQLMGVYDGRMARMMAEALAGLGAVSATVVHAADGCDEVSICAPTTMVTLEDGRISERRFRPEEVGWDPAPPEAVQIDGPEEGLRVALDVLQGRGGPCLRMVCLNAAAALMVAGLAADMEEGVEMAGRSIASGAAMARVEKLAGLRSPRAGLRRAPRGV